MSIYKSNCNKIITRITHKHIKITRSTTNTGQNKKELQMKDNTHLYKNENHVKKIWNSWLISRFSPKIFHNVITYCSCSSSALLFSRNLLLFFSISVCRIRFSIMHIMIDILVIFVCFVISLLLCCWCFDKPSQRH